MQEHLVLIIILFQAVCLEWQCLISILIVIFKSLVKAGCLINGSEEHRVNQVLPVNDAALNGSLGVGAAIIALSSTAHILSDIILASLRYITTSCRQLLMTTSMHRWQLGLSP